MEKESSSEIQEEKSKGKPGIEEGEGPKPSRLVKRKDLPPETKYSFEVPPEPIPEKDIKETVDSEIVVVGGGLAGVSAAISAAELGGKVILLEKKRTCQARGRDNAFIGSRLQKKLGIEIDANEVVLELMKYGANKPDQRLLRMWAEDGHETANWLLDMTDAAGLDVIIAQYPPPEAFDNNTEYYPQYLVTHQYVDEKPVIKCMVKNAVQKGVDIRYRMRARQLVRKGQGRVTSVVAQNANGDYIQFNAKNAVILCTGDYSYNSEMMAKYCPQALYMPSRMVTSTGEGHQMAMWVGAVMEPGPHAPMSHGFAGPAGAAAFLQVNILGERFQNEDIPGQSYTNAIERQPGQTAWQVFDSKFKDEIQNMGIGHGKIFGQDLDRILQPGRGFFRQPISAHTLEELAKKIEVPVETFLATVERYNGLARMGRDVDFGKRPDRLTTIERPPFYAGQGGYHLLVVMGGLNVNAKMQALDKDWKPIPGLYLAGNTMGNRFAVDYPTIAPGISHGMAFHYGRVAGLNAVRLEG